MVLTANLQSYFPNRPLKTHLEHNNQWIFVTDQGGHSHVEGNGSEHRTPRWLPPLRPLTQPFFFDLPPHIGVLLLEQFIFQLISRDGFEGKQVK